MRSTFAPILRRTVLLAALALAIPFVAAEQASAATPAEAFVSSNVDRGLTILNNGSLSTEQKRQQFERFLLSLTDMKRIAMFTLGQYRRGAAESDLDAFSSAFQNYAVAVYQSYFARYAGQTLQVTGSTNVGPQDDVVRTVLVDPHDKSGQQPLEVDFRVKSDTGRPQVVDFSVGGIWLGQEERDQFTAFLGQNNGDIHALIAHLGDLARQFKTAQQQPQH
jgi:phospholipid transport system substrate-binding protein